MQDRFLGSKSPQKDMRASSQPPVPTYTGVLTDRLKCYLRSAEHLCDEDTAVAAGRGSHTTSSGAASADANSAAVGSQQQQPGQSGSYLATGTLKGKTPEPYDSTAALTDLLTYFQTN